MKFIYQMLLLRDDCNSLLEWHFFLLVFAQQPSYHSPAKVIFLRGYFHHIVLLKKLQWLPTASRRKVQLAKSVRPSCRPLSPSNPVSQVGSLLKPQGALLLLSPLSLFTMLQFLAFFVHHPSLLTIIIQLTPLSRTTLSPFKKSSLIISALGTSLSPPPT